MIKLNFKKWLEVFGGDQPVRQDPEKLNNGAFPRYDIPQDELPQSMMKKKQKKQKKR